MAAQPPLEVTLAADPNQPPAPVVHMVRSYEKLRIGIAIVTIWFLSTLLYVRYSLGERGQVERNSISAYFHRGNEDWRMRDVFVSGFGAVGVMLVVYQGYTNRENLTCRPG